MNAKNNIDQPKYDSSKCGVCFKRSSGVCLSEKSN